MKNILWLYFLMIMTPICLNGTSAFAQDNLASFEQEVKEQKKALEEQARKLEELESRLNTAGSMKITADKGSAARSPENWAMRDAVGDLNAHAVSEGEFPGSIMIPGTQKVSLAVGGFIKTVAIGDSDIEGTGPIFLPAYIGVARPDTEGSTSLDASLSRVFLDARAPSPNGGVRGYLEVDLNNTNNGSLDFQVRHAYGLWRTDAGTLTVGHTWSTAMDLGVLPEGLTEPTVSGAIFQRQALLRWSQKLTGLLKYDIALEDCTSSDATINGPWRASTRLPDLIGAAEWDWGQEGHIRATGLFRDLRVTNDSGHSESAAAWGISLSGHIKIGENDKLAAGACFGEGAGRYLLGTPSGYSGFIDTSSGELDLLKSTGAFASYRHPWTSRLRSTAAYGMAWVEDASWQAADAFDSTGFGLINLMWSPFKYVTMGVEFQYGERETKDGASRDNSRVIFGVQIF